MSILILDGFAPSQGPIRYEVHEQDVYSSNEQTEDGHKHVERAWVASHTIPVAYTNLTSEEIATLKEKLDLDEIPTQYFNGAMTNGMFRLRSGTKTIKLKLINGGEAYWDIEFHLEEI